MADIEGIKFILEAEFRNEKQLDAFQEKLRAVRKEIAALRRAQRNLARSRVGVDGQKTSKRGRSQTQEEVRSLRSRNRLVQQITGNIQASNRANQIGLRIERQRLDVVTRLAAQHRLAAGAIVQQAAAQKQAEQTGRRASQQQERTNSVWSRYLGTIRGVVVGLIAYRGLTRSLQFINDAVRGAVEFGTELEIAEKAIGGLVLGAADVRDSMGNLAPESERFAAATVVAADQIAELRKQALGTSATFRELVGNFQLNVSQGLNAGLDLTEFREIALQFSQAATLLGLPQNQLAEEIRSVLQGTIRARDTRIAVSLGITNRQVRAAKDAGVFAEFLEDRLAGISKASLAISQTLPVLFSDIKDAFQFAATDGAEPFRQALTDAAKTLKGGLLDDDNEIVESLVTGFRELFDPLKGIVELLVEIREPLGELFATITTLGFEILESFVQTLVLGEDAIRAFTKALQGMVSAVRGVQSFFSSENGSAIGRVVVGVIAMTSALKVLGAALVGVGRAFRFLSPAFLVKWARGATGAAVAVRGLGKAMGLLAVFVAKPLVVIAALGLAFDEIFKRSERVRTVLGGMSDDVVDLAQQMGLVPDSPFLGGNTNFAESFAASDAEPFKDALTHMARVAQEGVDEILGVAEKGGEEFTASFDVSRLFTSQHFDDQLSEAVARFSGALKLSDASDVETPLVAVLERVIDLEEESVRLGNLRTQGIQARHDILSNEESTVAQRNVAAQDLVRLFKDQNEEGAIRADLIRQEILLQARAAEAQINLSEQQSRADLRLQQSLASIPEGSRNERVSQDIAQSENELLRLSQQREEIQRRSVQRAEVLRNITTNLRDLGASGVTKSFVLLRLNTRLAQIDKERSEALRLQAVRIAVQLQRLKEFRDLSAKGQGRARAVDSLSSQLTDSAIAERQLTETFSALRSGTQNAVREGLNAAFTGKDVDFGNIGLQIGVDAAAAFLNGVVDQLIFQPMIDAISNLFGLQLFNNIALEANSVALGFATAAIANLAFIMAARTALGLYHGGPVGFDEGGAVSGKSLNRPVPGLHSADRIPAMVRRGEYVATPEMNKRVPGLFNALEKIRHGVHNVPNFGTLRSASIPGFATGGGVSTDVAPAGSFSSGDGTQILPVLVTDARSLRRIHDTPQFVLGATRRTNASAMRTTTRGRQR